MENEINLKNIFITVGTTDFNTLINEINTKEFLNYLLKIKCQNIVIQYGRGNIIPTNIQIMCLENNINCDIYRFKDSLDIDMNNAQFIICHAGAGSITEALSLNKKVLVVINESLMDNHQAELAHAVVEQGYCFSTIPSHLLDTLETINFSKIKKYDEVDYNAFPRELDRMFGWDE